MTVYGFPSRWICLPRIDGLPPNRRSKRFHVKHDGISVRTIFALGKRASDDRIHPQSGNRFQVPPRALTSSGNSPRSPVRVNCHQRHAAMSSKPWVCVRQS